ncbi:MAG: hypothetical protein CMJ64_21400 [Planctomycetaceae bacterium]|nr:hypothetical protein [Planctomycetaceae bacterium]
MHTVGLLEQYARVAERLGYQVRHEWLGGGVGGACEFGGRKWIFVDLAVSPEEQLEQVAEALRVDPGIHLLPLTEEVARGLGIQRAA